MRDHRKYWMARVGVATLAGLAIMGFVVMLLWNNIVVDLFSLKIISYFQSLGLLVLVRILTGNFGPRGGGPAAMMHRKGIMHERWKNMSEEEKKDWVDRMK